MSRFTSSTEPPKEPPPTDPPSSDPPLPPKEPPTDGAPSVAEVVGKQDTPDEGASTAAQSVDREVVVFASQAPLDGIRTASLAGESIVVATQAPGPAADPSRP